MNVTNITQTDIVSKILLWTLQFKNLHVAWSTLLTADFDENNYSSQKWSTKYNIKKDNNNDKNVIITACNSYNSNNDNNNRRDRSKPEWNLKWVNRNLHRN